MAKTTIAAGFRDLFYGVVDSDGYFIGGTATAPTAGDQDGSGMIRLNGARTLPLNIPEPDIQVVTGDDEPMVSFEFDSENLPSGAFEMAARDNTFEALIQGTSVNVLSSDAEVSVLDPKDRASQTMCLLLSRRAKSWQIGTRGVARWESLFVPRCTIKPLGASIEQRTHTPYQYSINASRSDRTGWSTVSETNHGTTAASIFPIDSDNPLHMQRFTGDNAETVFNLDYTAVSGAKCYVFVNDVQQTITTEYAVSGKTLTFVAAPATDAVIVVLYEVAEADLS
jgi:hypothetical protein